MSLADYDLREPLGRGLTGIVYRAIHRPTGTPVALKEMHTNDARMVRAVEQEVRAMARVAHPNLLSIYDHGRLIHDDGLWLALEFASGGSLDDWLPVDWDDLWQVLDDVLHGLAHAHARGLVHRDLKPENLLLAQPTDASPGVKIGDFGLTTLRDEDPAVLRGGTPLYMPPEQWVSTTPLPASDLYALGGILWRWVTGRNPYSGDTLAALKQAHHAGSLPPFAPRFNVPEPVEPLLRDMLATSASDRPATAGQVRRRLEGTSHRGAIRLLLRPSPTPPPVPPGLGLALLTVRDHAVVGRLEARQELVGTLEQVVKQLRPHVQLLSGPRGIGKTRMARWLGESAAEIGAVRLMAQPTLAEAQEAAEASPVVALFDDLTPEIEARLLGMLTTSGPLLALACVAPAWSSSELERQEHVHRLELGPMDRTSYRWFLHGGLGLSPATARRLDRAGKGVPGIGHAWASELAARGKLRPGREGFELVSGTPPDPPSMQDGQRRMVALLCEGASQQARAALSVATLLGHTVPERAWEDALEDLGLPMPEALVLQLVTSRVWVPTSHGWRWSGEDALEAARGPHVPREAWRAAADALYAQPPSTEHRIRAGLARLHSGDVAAARRQLLVTYPMRMAVMESVREVIEALRPHMDDAPVTERVAHLRLDLVWHLNLVSRYAAAPYAEQLAEFLGTVHRPGPWRDDCRSGVCHRALETAAITFTHLARLGEAEALVEGLPESSDNLRIRSAIAKQRGQTEEALALALRGYAASPPERHALRAALANMIGELEGTVGDAASAEQWFRRSVEHAESGTAFIQQINVALALLAQSRPRDAVRPARLALAGAEQAGRMVPTAYVVYGIVAALAGQTAEVRRFGDTVLAMVRRDPGIVSASIATPVRNVHSDDPVIQRFLDALVPLLPRQQGTSAASGATGSVPPEASG